MKGARVKDDKVKDQNRKEVNFSKGRGIVYSIALAMAVCLLTGLAITFNVKRIEAKRTSIAIEAVQDLYQFSKVKDFTTQSVYNQLTVDNEERTLNTYLKFKGAPTTVNVVKATSSYILYTLTNENIDKDRVFIFMYDFNSKGQISKVRESECLDFLK